MNNLTFGNIGDIVKDINCGEAIIVNNIIDKKDRIKVCVNNITANWFIKPLTILSKTKTDNKSYCFHSASIHDIDFKAIQAELTSKNPIALVSMSNGTNYIVIQKQFIVKALLTSKRLFTFVNPPEKFKKSFEGIMPIKKEFSEWVLWAKEVRQAKWGEHKKANKVTVSLPTI